ncbi:GST protein [Aphelenchoides bicaudatus]|nr:GST protein [Aphelenchoides bicaudatus]
MAEYTLHYFDVRGRGEPIRLILQYAKVPFNDVRIQRQEWRAKKQTFPFGQLPVLETNGQLIPQSYAIARYLSKKYGLYGSNYEEAAQIDAVADLYKDFIFEVAPYLHRKPTADKEQMKKSIFEPALEKFIPLFEKLLEQSKSGFFGKNVSFADFFFAEGIQSLKNVEPESLKDHPIITEHQERVHSLPDIKDYVANRPYSDF